MLLLMLKTEFQALTELVASLGYHLSMHIALSGNLSLLHMTASHPLQACIVMLKIGTACWCRKARQEVTR